MVTWERNTPLECPGRDRINMTIDKSSTSYTIMGLEEYSVYTITVTAIMNLKEDSIYTITVAATIAAGRAVSDSVTGITKEGGEEILT